MGSQKYIFLIFVLVFGISAGVLFFVFLSPDSLVAVSDYVSFLTGAKMIFSGVREKYYDLETQYLFQTQITNNIFSKKMLLPFIYPPYYALIFYPFLYLKLKTGYILFSLLIFLSILFLPFFSFLVAALRLLFLPLFFGGTSAISFLEFRFKFYIIDLQLINA